MANWLKFLDRSLKHRFLWRKVYFKSQAWNCLRVKEYYVTNFLRSPLWHWTSLNSNQKFRGIFRGLWTVTWKPNLPSSIVVTSNSGNRNVQLLFFDKVGDFQAWWLKNMKYEWTCSERCVLGEGLEFWLLTCFINHVRYSELHHSTKSCFECLRKRRLPAVRLINLASWTLTAITVYSALISSY